MKPTVIAVGLPFPTDLDIQPNTGAINLADSSKEMMLSYQRPHPLEIDAFQNGKGRFWLIYQKGVIVLQFRFLNEKTGGKVEGEYPFHVGFLDEKGVKFSLDNIEEDQHYMFTFSLIDHDTKIVKALRVFTLGPLFLGEFKKLIEKQRTEKPSTEHHNYRYQELASKYSVSQLRKMAVCYCNVGCDSKGAL